MQGQVAMAHWMKGHSLIAGGYLLLGGYSNDGTLFWALLIYMVSGDRFVCMREGCTLY